MYFCHENKLKETLEMNNIKLYHKYYIYNIFKVSSKNVSLLNSVWCILFAVKYCLSVGYINKTYRSKGVVAGLLLLFMTLASLGFGQGVDVNYNDCTGYSHPLFSSWNLPNSVCAGENVIFTVGYEPTDSIVIAPQVPEPPAPHSMPIPNQPTSTDECINTSTINYSGYSGTIQSNSIRFVRLNIYHPAVGDLYIRLRCPSGATATILNSSFPDDGTNYNEWDECASNIPSGDRGWNTTLDEDDLFWIRETPFGSVGDNYANYCWSNHNSPNIQYSTNIHNFIC